MVELVKLICKFILLALFLGTFGGMALIYLLFDDPIPEKTKYPKDKYGKLHAPVMMGGAVLLGLSVIIFRMLAGAQTRMIKYIHTIMELLALVAFGVGYYYAKRDADSSSHERLGYQFMIAFLIQFVIAAFVFAYLYEARKARIYFAPFHGIIGLWVLTFCFIAILTGLCEKTQIQNLYPWSRNKDSKYEDFPELKNTSFDFLLGLIYAMFLIAASILLTPYFEWELVGEL